MVNKFSFENYRPADISQAPTDIILKESHEIILVKNAINVLIWPEVQ
jgi:hypothetical protein